MGMTAVVTNIDKAQTSKKFIVNGTITLSGNYGTSGGALPHGDTLDLSGIVPCSGPPNRVQAWSSVPKGSAPLNDSYHFNPGSGQADGVLQIMLAGTEMTPGATYAGTSPTNVTGYVLNFEAEFFPAEL